MQHATRNTQPTTTTTTTAAAAAAAAATQVTDATFGGSDPCSEFGDSKLGEQGTADAAVAGTDPFPRSALPYHASISKRLFVQVTCEGVASFASNCQEECRATGRCLYGLAPPYCGWCTTYGLQPRADGTYDGEGCGSSFCVKEASCSAA
jgi:hypothetical protein